jgi:hypothetical protein
MGQPGMRITVDAAMRARDVSRPRPHGEEPPPNASANGSGSGTAQGRQPETGKRGKAAKNERRRLDKRGARRPGP